MQEYADKCKHAKNTDLNVGDKVLIKQPKQNKMSTPFKPEPFEITDKERSIITAQNVEHNVIRNASFFKKLPFNIPVHPVPSDEEEQSTPFIDAVEVVEPIATVEPPTVTPVKSPTVTPVESPTVTPVESPVNAPVEPPGVATVELPALCRSARARRVPDQFKYYVT